MNITVKKIKQVSHGKLVAFADVSFEGVVVKGCKVFIGANGLFATLPSQKNPKDDKYYDIVVLEDTELKANFVSVVVRAYKELSGEFDQVTADAKNAGLFGAEEVPLNIDDNAIPF